MGAPVKMLAFDLGASSGRAMLGIYEKGRLSIEEIHRFPNEPVSCGDIIAGISCVCSTRSSLVCARPSMEDIKLVSIAIDT